MLLALRVMPVLGLFLVLTATAFSGMSAGTHAATTPLAPVAGRALVLGDSISAAYGMSLEQGWVALLERRLEARLPDVELINASISGDTSAGGLRRLPGLLQEHRPALVIIELGGNDGLRGYPSAKLQENLEAMTDLALASGARVLILPMEIPPNYGPRYTRAFRAAFDAAADREHARLGPFMLDGIATRPELMQADGIHPTIAAQRLIVDLLEPDIEELLGADLLAATLPTENKR